METRKKYLDLSKMKAELKEIRQDICQQKEKIKNFHKELSFAKNIETKLDVKRHLKIYYGEYHALSNHCRHMHIAYSELRGKTREQIEKTTPRAKALAENVIKTLKLQFSPETE